MRRYKRRAHPKADRAAGLKTYNGFRHTSDADVMKHVHSRRIHRPQENRSGAKATKETYFFFDYEENDVTNTNILEDHYNDYELDEEFESFDSWLDSLCDSGRLEEISKRKYNMIRNEIKEAQHVH